MGYDILMQWNTVNFLCSYKCLRYNTTLTIKNLTAVNIQQNTYHTYYYHLCH